MRQGGKMKNAEQLVNDKDKKLVTVSPDTVICDALKVMVDKGIGAILVKEGDQITGIWTERDLMRNTLLKDFDPNTHKVSDYMSTQLVSVPHTANLYNLQDKFLGKRLRHLLVEKEDKYIGLLTPGDVMRADLNLKTSELKQLNAIVSWEYYENWRW
jgi:signal-transduction protein with cAMP-binding, CBS, and nucleotidyltransferase domain